MKKIMLIICLVLILSLSACIKNDITNTNSQGETDNSGTNSTVLQNEQTKACEHSWINATCTSPKKCSTCGETEGTTIAHNFSPATCTSPKKCSVCGVTEGTTTAHSFSSGKCTGCGQADPNAEKIKKALIDSERYVNYIDIEADIILNTIDLYRINGKTSLLLDMQESVNEINSYYEKIYNYCSPYRELYPLYSECDKEMPIFSSSSLAKLKTYATQAGRLKSTYDAMCSYYK